MKLVAKIALSLDAPIHVSTAISNFLNTVSQLDPDVYSPTDPPRFRVQLDEFKIQIELKLDLADNPLLKGHKIYACDRIEIVIERAIDSEISTVEEININYRDSFLVILHTVVNRFIAFARYQLGNPFLRRLNAGHIVVWEWYSEELLLHRESAGHIMFRFPGLPNNKNSLGSLLLKRNQTDDVINALQKPVYVSVAQELLAQAQEAIFEGKGFLAVVLLAISTEVAIKNAFFRHDSVASEAIDYLEEKRQIEISPIELIHKVAKRAFGQSFIDFDNGAYDSIDNLFRCRNRIVHRGIATFRDKKEGSHIPTAETLVEWWNSVSTLQKWLDQRCRPNPNLPISPEEYIFAVDAWQDIPSTLTGG